MTAGDWLAPGVQKPSAANLIFSCSRTALVSPSSTPRLLVLMRTAAVRVSAQLARSYARTGAYDKFTETLRATQIRLDRLHAPSSGLFAVDPGRVACYLASSYIWLGRPAQAVPHAKEAIAFYGEVGPEGRCPTREALAHLDLAMAHVELGTPDDAAQEIHTALNSERLTSSVVSRFGRLADAMNRKYPQLDLTRTVHQHNLLLTANLSRPALPSP